MGSVVGLGILDRLFVRRGVLALIRMPIIRSVCDEGEAELEITFRGGIEGEQLRR